MEGSAFQGAVLPSLSAVVTLFPLLLPTGVAVAIHGMHRCATYRSPALLGQAAVFAYTIPDCQQRLHTGGQAGWAGCGLEWRSSSGYNCRAVPCAIGFVAGCFTACRLTPDYLLLLLCVQCAL